MKFINENEVVNGRATIILFLVCVPKRRNLSISCFEVSKKRAWKQIETLEWKLKRNVAPVPSEMVRSLAQEEGATYIILTWFCFPCFFKNTESGSSPTSIE